jgi:Ni,Fe-hydrogenase III small subunit
MTPSVRDVAKLLDVSKKTVYRWVSQQRLPASPRLSDGILITGPITSNMREALLSTYEAAPEPRIVIASEACAYVPGCPPHPLTLLDAPVRSLGRIPD